jgi:amino acid adenylation domain-containing protein
LIDGQPVQIVQPSAEVSIKTVDLSSLSEDTRQTEIALIIKSETERPFDLSTGQLLRWTVIRARDNDHVLILTTHHSVSDAWSMGILTRELWSVYEAFSIGKPSPLDPLQIQYSDYAVWQRNWLQGDVLESQLSYWKERLNDVSILNMPTDRPRKPRQSFCGARLAIVLPEDLTRSLNELSNRFAGTPFMTLLAAFQVLLYRYTGQEDVVVGSPIANRRRPEVEGLIGFFVNTLVLRADLSGHPSFSEFLSQVRDTCVGSDTNQDLPFEKLVQELQPERDQSRNPLFQVMFVLQNATRPFTGIPGLRIEPLEVATARSPFDLSLFLREREGKYIGYIEYSTDLFDRDRIERMAGHFQTLLEGIVSDPDQSIATLPILTEAERHQILVEWNNTAADYPKDKCIQHLFEEQVERTPDAVAVEFEDKQITYRELNLKANQLAHYLMTLGIDPEKLVGICVERSIEMVVGLLGILKAGGAYVPLDPAYPKERLRFMLEDSRVLVLLTQEKLIGDRGWRVENGGPPGVREDGTSKIDDSGDPEFLRPGSGQASIFNPRLQVVCLDRHWPLIAQQNGGNPELALSPHNLAYVIYTSGSTGEPKGVAIEHRNTVNLLCWAKGTYGPSELAGVLGSTSICFDLSVFEFFVPLSWGGKIILAENVLSLREGIHQGITLVNTVPSAMAALLAAGSLPGSVRVVNLAGEPVRPELVNQLYRTGTIEKVYDLYGPSETTTYSTFSHRAPNGRATIGRPIANTKIYLLDSNCQPVPVGVPGEIFIGGAGVARGYLDRPDLTKEKFISDPFTGQPGTRLYYTGDLARYLPDGNIEFLGRRDNQVKIRGYRIELGEIESVLNQHPAVKDSVLMVRARYPLEETITAYVVPKHQSVSLVGRLRRYLIDKLPHYMIPSNLVILDSFPLSTNGKIDRNALPGIENPKPQIIDNFTEPTTEIEKLVAQTWRDVLKIENIGIHDNFFWVGGNSLLAVQIASRLQETFTKTVPLQTIFEAPTVATLAREIENLFRGAEIPTLPTIVRVPRDAPLPLSMNQEHLWYLDQMIPGTPFFNIPCVYRLIGHLNVTVLQTALKEIIRRHEAFRTTFTTIDGRPVQIIHAPSDFEPPMVDLQNFSDSNLAQMADDLIAKETKIAFDLSVGPLIRTKLLHASERESLLVITVHHIISDQWSMQLFSNELVALYDAFFHGLPSPLPEPPIQFVDYACWERGLLEKGLFDEHLSNYSKQFDSRSPRLEFQNVKQTPELTFHTNRLSIEFDRTLFSGIKDLARRENCTPFMVLISAVTSLLYSYSGQPDIRIGTLVANRHHKNTADAIGYFVNTVILHIRVQEELTYRQLLKRVREECVAAYAYQAVPFEKMARTLEEREGVNRSELFQVLFNYDNIKVGPTRTDDLSIAVDNWQRPIGSSEPMFTTLDLIFNMREKPTTLTGRVDFRPDSMDECFVRQMINHFQITLQRAVVEPELRVGSTQPGL